VRPRYPLQYAYFQIIASCHTISPSRSQSCLDLSFSRSKLLFVANLLRSQTLSTIFQTLLSAVDLLVSRFNFLYLIVSSSVVLGYSSLYRLRRCADGLTDADPREQIVSRQKVPTVTPTAAFNDSELHFVLCLTWKVAVDSTNWKRTEKRYEEIERKDEVEPNSSRFLSGTIGQ